ncbi:MAG: hypothetical protein MJ073_03310 [Oscillibacter sp.]|nr:hypothetical protein [Oscillibacter sp.]
MNQLLRTVFFLEEDSAIPVDGKPLMLETIVNRPALSWAAERLIADGVQRFFVVSSPRFVQQVRACFPAEADLTVSEQQTDLMAFLNTPDEVFVLPRAAVPMEVAGVGFAYSAPGYELQEIWKDKMTNAITAATLVPGWLPIFGPETIAELEPILANQHVTDNKKKEQ